jgi:hypothetical protein
MKNVIDYNRLRLQITITPCLTVVNEQNYIGVAYQSSMPQDMLLLAGGYIPETESSF